MILSESDAVWAADKFINYYTQFNRIDDYLRFVKKDRINERSGSLFGADMEFFDGFDIKPNDMNFEVHIVDTNPKTVSKYNQWLYSETLNLTASNPIEEAIPGRTHKWIVVLKQIPTKLLVLLGLDLPLSIANPEMITLVKFFLFLISMLILSWGLTLFLLNLSGSIIWAENYLPY